MNQVRLRLDMNRSPVYDWLMEFTWNEDKNREVLAERGFDFDHARRAFDDPGRVVEPDTGFYCGEDRFRVLGMIEGRVFAVVHAPRDQAHHIITAWKANRKEVGRYNDVNQNQG